MERNSAIYNDILKILTLIKMDVKLYLFSIFNGAVVKCVCMVKAREKQRMILFKTDYFTNKHRPKKEIMNFTINYCYCTNTNKRAFVFVFKDPEIYL